MILTFAAEARALDQHTIDAVGVPGVALMELAGVGVADALCRRLPPRARVALVCGRGNNGGDGHVIARHLLARGHHPEVFLLASPDDVQGDAAVNLRALRALDIPLHLLHGEAFDRALERLIGAPWDVYVDALLGTGLHSPVRDRAAQLIDALNQTTARVVAVDLPSGLSADTGQPLGVAIQATLTVTFGHLKPGLVLYPGRALAGDVEVVDLGFPPSALDAVAPQGRALTLDDARARLPPRDPTLHKGRCGKVVAVGGAPGKAGAVILSGAAALEMGAGLVTVGLHPDLLSAPAQARLALMSAPLLPHDLDALDPPTRARLLDAAQAADVIAVGPGLGLQPGALAVLSTLLDAERPLVLDADALNLLAQHPDAMRALDARAHPTVITPHPGEMARLTDSAAADVQRDRLHVARRFARDHGVITVLKSASTVVAHPDGRYAINTTGNPGMATAGAGDVLTGVVAALLGQGLDPWDAACAAVCLHGAAGDEAAARFGERAVTADKLLDALSQVCREAT